MLYQEEAQFCPHCNTVILQLADALAMEVSTIEDFVLADERVSCMLLS